MQLELLVSNEINEIYKRIRNYLAGRVIGITRDKSLLDEVVKCLFCHLKISQDNYTSDDTLEMAKQYRNSFSELKSVLSHIFKEEDEILLDPSSIYFVHNELSLIDFSNPKVDPLGELYQAFIGSDLRMAEGQFFTPNQAIAWIIEAVQPKKNERIIDPACGPGGFLSYSARYLLSTGVSLTDINSSLYGIEKDEYLANLANAHISLVSLNKANIFCADSIEWKKKDGSSEGLPELGPFDVVVANPPFGSKIISGSEKTRRGFDLAYKWKLNKDDKRYYKTDNLQTKTPPQILFVELCIKLLKTGGRLGIVVPESLLSSSSTNYVVQYIKDNLDIMSVCGMPETLFKTSGKGGTHTKTCLLIGKKKGTQGESNNHNKIFMAEAKWCGHDSRGNRIPHNDLPITLENFQKKDKLKLFSNLGYLIGHDQIKDNILAPRYYDPEPKKLLSLLNQTHEVISIGELIQKGILEITTGDEVGKLAYGTGKIPFVRTSDISNWEIKLDPKHGVSEEIYLQYQEKQDVKEGDILMVRDGTYLIGSCAYISKYDTKMVYQSHLYKIRVKDKKYLSPFLLLSLLSSEPVLRQIKAKRFTQDIIDSLGNRISEIELPIPISDKHILKVIQMVQKSIEDRIEARELARSAKVLIVDPNF